MKTNELANEYYNLINCLPRLTQDEIVDLYNSEHIPYTDLEQEIKALEKDRPFTAKITDIDKKIKELKSKLPTPSYRYYLTVMGRKHNIRKYPSEELRNKIVEGTMYLAIIYASIYTKKLEGQIEFDELFQIASEALISAAHYYIPNGPTTFTTYASKCISNKIKKSLSKKMKPLPKNFFTKENQKLNELNLILASEKSTHGNRYYPSQDEYRLILKLNRYLKEYNSHKYIRQEPESMVPRCYKKSYDEVLDRLKLLVKSSKLNLLITDEDIQNVESYANYKNFPKDETNYFKAKLYLEIYMQKLESIEMYLQAEKNLESSSEEKSDENIIKEMNLTIKKINSQIYKYRQEGLYEEDYFPYKRLHDYFNEYYNTYNVDLFGNKEDKDLYTRYDEKAEIASQYYDTIYQDIAESIEKINNIKTPLVIAFYDSEQENTGYIKDYVPDYIADVVPYESKEELDGFDEKSKQEYIFSLSDKVSSHYTYKILPIEVVTEELQKSEKIFSSKENFVNAVLKARANYINSILKEKNKSRLAHNLKMRKREDIYQKGSAYHKYINENHLSNIKSDINILYTNEQDLFDYLLENSPSKVIKRTLEEEICEDIFLSDYYTSLDDLSSMQKKIMLMSYDDYGKHNYSIQEIANLLNEKPSKIKNEKSKAIKKLRKNPILKSYIES